MVVIMTLCGMIVFTRLRETCTANGARGLVKNIFSLKNIYKINKGFEIF